MSAVEFWEGKQGDDYILRNPVDLNRSSLQAMWMNIFSRTINKECRSILEVGANVGRNLKAISSIHSAKLYAVEPNHEAYMRLLDQPFIDGSNVFEDHGSALPFRDSSINMVFTSGVLIHIPPDQLMDVCSEIVRVSSRYVVAIEYFSAKPEMIPYRGENDRLWKRDFGKLYADRFKLTPISCGFEWKETTGLDNLTWWVFRK